VTDPGERVAAPPGAVNWRTIAGRERNVAIVRLDNWVSWICGRLSIPSDLVPDCWWRHGPLIEELSALHTAWLASFDEHDGGAGPLAWLERFDLARARLRRLSDRCAADGHHDPPARSLTPWPITEGEPA
jgi:hypothetical protein